MEERLEAEPAAGLELLLLGRNLAVTDHEELRAKETDSLGTQSNRLVDLERQRLDGDHVRPLAQHVDLGRQAASGAADTGSFKPPF